MTTRDEHSVTRWIGHLKEGDSDAAHHLCERYFRRIVGLARAKLGDTRRGASDEEDVALSAFRNLCEGAAHGRFDLLHDRDDLWRLLVVITARKAADLKKRENRVKRGGGRILDQGGLGDDSHEPAALELIAGDEPTPEFIAEVAEEFQRRLDRLGDATLQRVALLRLEGYEYDEIAERLGIARRTVARKLEMIREAWSRTAEGSGAV